MRATSLGHAGILIESDRGSIVCDPWFVPAFFGSWFPFPRNDRLDDDLLARIEGADFLYVSHLHGDHWDEPWLRSHLPRDIGVLLPGYPTRELDRRMRELGFTNLIRTTDSEELDLDGARRRHPRRDEHHRRPRRRLGAGRQRRHGPHRRPERLPHHRPRRPPRPRPRRPALAAVQRGDLVPDGLRPARPDELQPLVRAKVDSQLARAMRYVEAVGARAVVPSAGPPCFLDPELFHLNVITGDEPSIFVDQRVFLDRLGDSGHHGILAVPGTTIDVTAGRAIAVTHPGADGAAMHLLTDKATHLREYQADWLPWIGELKAWLDQARRRGPGADAAGVVGAAAGDGPDAAGRRRHGVPAARRRRRGAHRLPGRRGPALRRRAVRLPVRHRPCRWSRPSSPSGRSTGATRCSCRAASAPGATASSTSGSTTSSSRCPSSGCGAPRPRPCAASTRRPRPSPTSSSARSIVQRRCPHRNADLAVFGEIDDCVADVHPARLALRPRDRPLPHRRRPPDPRPSPLVAVRAHLRSGGCCPTVVAARSCSRV